uniref:CCR4-NOT transcription complex subunit 10 n=1 Tax=Timema bartmani TaxID=61472 RepID=A0A7R9EZP8_9NEOP|nr:unnamed protein product [Timema bartmani]
MSRHTLTRSHNICGSTYFVSREPYSGRPVHTVGSNKQYELMYNVGVCLLYGGQPTRAFDCLTEAIQVYHMNPRLWLRLAECCIMAHKQGNEHDFDIQSRKKDLVQGVVGSGIHRKLILNPSLSNDNCYSCEGQSYAIPVATLEFASLCLRNALLLLPDVQPEETLPVVPPSDGGDVPVVPAALRGLYAAPSSPMEPHEVASLRCSVLADSAYVALCLGDSVVALGHAQNLLMQPKLSGVHRMLGHLYAAEALVLMDRIADSIEHLNADLIKDLSLVLPPSDTRDLERDKGEGEEHKPLKGWFPHSLPTARAVLQYNLAVAFAIRGELEKAGDTLKQVWLSKNVSCDIPVHVIMLALYIELQLVVLRVSHSLLMSSDTMKPKLGDWMKDGEALLDPLLTLALILFHSKSVIWHEVVEHPQLFSVVYILRLIAPNHPLEHLVFYTQPQGKFIDLLLHHRSVYWHVLRSMLAEPLQHSLLQICVRHTLQIIGLYIVAFLLHYIHNFFSHFENREKCRLRNAMPPRNLHLCNLLLIHFLDYLLLLHERQEGPLSTHFVMPTHLGLSSNNTRRSTGETVLEL